MSTEFWTGQDVDGLVERLAAHLDEHAALAGTPDRIGPDRDGAGSLTQELRAAATWAGPPAGLRDLILTRVRADRAPTATAPERSAQPEDTTVSSPAQPAAARVTGSEGQGLLTGLRARWRRLAWAVPATAVAAALFTIGVLAVDRALQPGEPPAEVFAIAASQLAPQARGEVRVSAMPSGFSILVDVEGMPAAAPGSYYAAWLRGPEGMIPLGSFHMRSTGAPVRLWSGVPPDRYPEFVVTLQAEGDPLVPSQLVVITASLDR
jgi:hypothetical protein